MIKEIDVICKHYGGRWSADISKIIYINQKEELSKNRNLRNSIL